MFKIRSQIQLCVLNLVVIPLVVTAAMALVAPTAAEAKLWRNAYVSFEMPDGWDCTLEQTEWVCRSGDAKEGREAIIVLTAKEVGPMDTFEAYSTHLATAQQVTYRNLGTSTSRVIYPPKRVNVNQHPWVDGLHLGSEVPSYFTRYLATIKDRIAVLVTFSAHRDHYAKYSSAFFRAVSSLRVIASANLLSKSDLGPLRPANGELIGGMGNSMPSDIEGGDVGDYAANSSSGSKTKTMLLVIALILAGGGLYVFMKSKKR